MAADTSTAFGAQAAYRQLIDLVARGRAPMDDTVRARLSALRPHVPVETRAAVARGLALVDPPVALVRFAADDRAEVAAAALRGVRLSPEDWEGLVAQVGPFGRSVLRRRADLPPSTTCALERFGSTDFAITHEGSSVAVERVAEASQKNADVAGSATHRIDGAREPERFEIAELVDRIAAFQRERAAPSREAPAKDSEVAAFRFETDAAGVIRWIDSAPRGAVIGVTLDHEAPTVPCVDGVAAGAFRKRSAFADARLIVAGTSPLGGDWRISGIPVFDPARGQFVGYRGAARRPRMDEDAARVRSRDDSAASEGLRRLVHELRTPTNAIAGFSELIEAELLGPVAPAYRDRAATIRRHVGGLSGAIDDLDTAARIESAALHLRDEAVDVAALLGRIAGDLAPLAARRGATLDVAEPSGLFWQVDAVAAERLLSRLASGLLATARPGERLWIRQAGDAAVAIACPAALLGRSETDLLSLDDEHGGEGDDAPLLGLGFALRLSRRLAGELGGRLAFASDRLTVTLPAASTVTMEPAFTTAP